jgi:hypothetical protein
MRSTTIPNPCLGKYVIVVSYNSRRHVHCFRDTAAEALTLADKIQRNAERYYKKGAPPTVSVFQHIVSYHTPKEERRAQKR